MESIYNTDFFYVKKKTYVIFVSRNKKNIPTDFISVLVTDFICTESDVYVECKTAFLTYHFNDTIPMTDLIYMLMDKLLFYGIDQLVFYENYNHDSIDIEKFQLVWIKILHYCTI